MKTETSENKIKILKKQLEELNKQGKKVHNKIDIFKANPAKTIEARNLQEEIGIRESKLQSTKDKANESKNALKNNSGINGSLINILDKAKDKASSLKDNIKNIFTKNKGMDSFNKKLDGISKKISQFGRRITGLITSAFIFNVLSKGLSNLSNGLIGALKSNNQFSSSLSQIKGNLITAFAPVYNYILPAVNTLMSALTSLTGQFATFMSSVLGQTSKQAQKNAQALYNQAKAYGSVEEAQGNLASFDNLEVIGGNDNNSKSGNGNTTPDFNNELAQSGKLLDFLNEIKMLISTEDWGGLASFLSEKTVNLLSSISSSIKSINWDSIGKGISTFLTNIDFGGILTGLVSVFGEAVIGFQNLILEIDWPTVFKNLSIGIRDSIYKIAEYLGQIRWSEIGQKLSESFTSIDWGGIGSSILEALWNGLSGIVNLFLSIDWKQVGATISTAVHEWITTIVDKFLNTDWEQLGRDIVNAIFDFIRGVNWIQLAQDILLGLASGIMAFIGLITGAFEAIWNAILEFFGIHSPSTLAQDMGTNLMQGLLNGIKALKDTVVNFFKSIWEGIKNAFGNVTSWFKNTFSQAWNAVKNVFSTGGKIFDGIKDGILSAFKTVVNGIIGGINKVVSIPFRGINTALSKIKNINILGNKPFNGLINTISIPQIPYLAKGAVIPPNAKFAAILGDQRHGKNLEAPEGLIRQIIREETGDKEVILNATFIIQCDDIELGKVSYNGIRLMEKKNGKKYFLN